MVSTEPVAWEEVQMIKARIDGVGRLKVARRMGVTYSLLSNKLGGFIGTSPQDLARMKKAVDELASGKVK